MRHAFHVLRNYLEKMRFPDYGDSIAIVEIKKLGLEKAGPSVTKAAVMSNGLIRQNTLKSNRSC
jgi:hypothetical protein